MCPYISSDLNQIKTNLILFFIYVYCMAVVLIHPLILLLLFFLLYRSSLCLSKEKNYKITPLSVFFFYWYCEIVRWVIRAEENERRNENVDVTCPYARCSTCIYSHVFFIPRYFFSSFFRKLIMPNGTNDSQSSTAILTPSTQTTCPWKKTAPQDNSPSFRELMDSDLAAKLQKEEEDKYQHEMK